MNTKKKNGEENVEIIHMNERTKEGRKEGRKEDIEGNKEGYHTRHDLSCILSLRILKVRRNTLPY